MRQLLRTAFWDHQIKKTAISDPLLSNGGVERLSAITPPATTGGHDEIARKRQSNAPAVEDSFLGSPGEKSCHFKLHSIHIAEESKSF